MRGKDLRTRYLADELLADKLGSERAKTDPLAGAPFVKLNYKIGKGIPTLENNTSLCWDAWNGMWNKVVTTDEDIATLVRECHNKWVGYLADEG